MPLSLQSPDEKLARSLSKSLRRPLAAFHSLLAECSLVANGVRQSHLVDALALAEDELLPLLEAFRKAYPQYLRTFFAYERATQQTFLINADLLLSSGLNGVRQICLNRDGKEVDLPRTVQKLYEALLGHADASPPNLPAAPFVLGPQVLHDDEDLHRDVSVSDGRQDMNLHTTMVALAGLLLEYPFIYVLENTDELNNIPLKVLELVHESDEQSSITILKCSLPAESALAAPADLADHLERARSVFTSRLDSVGTADCFIWRLHPPITLSKVAL